MDFACNDLVVFVMYSLFAFVVCCLVVCLLHVDVLCMTCCFNA